MDEMSSPTQRTLRWLRKLGWSACVVEKYNHFARVRQDAFGILDLIAYAEGIGILGVQTTSKSNISSREKKLRENEHTWGWLKAGGYIAVVAWEKGARQPVIREIVLDGKSAKLFE